MLSIAVSPVSSVAVSALYAHISSFSTSRTHMFGTNSNDKEC
jgi:hypothetical protein